MKNNPSLISYDQITEKNKKIYNKNGALIMDDFISLLGQKILIKASKEDVKLSDKSEEFTPGFNRFSNRFITRSNKFKKLLDELSEPLSQVTGSDVVFTQALLLEMREENNGFPWHFDEYSYCFIRPQDMGCSLWIPLAPIHTKGQHGGMNWVNQDDFSAKSRMQQWAFHQKNGLQVEAKKRMEQWAYYQETEAEIPSNEYDVAKWAQYGDRWAGDYDIAMLEHLKKEADMELGSALLFNRYTWHKTHKLHSGAMPSRTAIVFRMVSADALFDKKLFGKTMALRSKTKVPDSFGHMLMEFKDGISMREAADLGVSIFSSTTGHRQSTR